VNKKPAESSSHQATFPNSKLLVLTTMPKPWSPELYLCACSGKPLQSVSFFFLRDANTRLASGAARFLMFAPRISTLASLLRSLHVVLETFPDTVNKHWTQQFRVLLVEVHGGGHLIAWVAPLGVDQNFQPKLKPNVLASFFLNRCHLVQNKSRASRSSPFPLALTACEL